MTRQTATKPWRSRSITHGLFKADQPRAIDRYIDYFGGDTTVASCGAAALSDLVHAMEGGPGDVPLAG